MGALSLHGRELEPERQLTVYVSDPQRKQGRTDASANDREIHVAGLARSVKEIDLKKIFEVVRIRFHDVMVDMTENNYSLEPSKIYVCHWMRKGAREDSHLWSSQKR